MLTNDQIAAYGRALHKVFTRAVEERPLTEEDVCIIAASALTQLLVETYGPVGAVDFLRSVADHLENTVMGAAFSNGTLQ